MASEAKDRPERLIDVPAEPNGVSRAAEQGHRWERETKAAEQARRGK